MNLIDVISANLRMLREEQEKKQSDIAEYLQIPTSTYSNYEQGSARPDYEILCKLARYYEVSLDFILGLTRKRQAENKQIQTGNTKFDLTGLYQLNAHNLRIIQEIVDAFNIKQES